VLAGLAVLALRFERRFGPAGRAAEAPA
jgi:hypothetical protein